jgi:hypothetical protein
MGEVAPRIESAPVRARRRWSRIWPWLLVAFVVLLASPWILWLSVTIYGAHQARLEEDRIRALGEPVTPADMESYFPPLPPQQDVTGLWIEATAPLDEPDFKMAVDALLHRGEEEEDVPLPGEPWPELEAAEEFLSQHAQSLLLLHEAAERNGVVRLPADFSAGIEMPLDEINAFRGGANLLTLEAYVRAHRGDATGTSRSIQALFALAKSLEQEPIIVYFLVRIACDGVVCNQIRRLLPNAGFSAQELRTLQDVMRRIEYRPGLKRALIGERVIGLVAFDNPATVGARDVNLQGWRPYSGSDRAYYQQIMARLIAACDQPWPAAIEESHNVDQELEVLASRRFARLRHIITLLILPALHACFDAGARGNANLAATDAAIAIELYRRQNGKAPERLDELVPDFLPAMPIDPFDGQPLRYIVRANECVIYSIGKDLKDDGGKGDERGAKDDLVFVFQLP